MRSSTLYSALKPGSFLFLFFNIKLPYFFSDFFTLFFLLLSCQPASQTDSDLTQCKHGSPWPNHLYHTHIGCCCSSVPVCADDAILQKYFPWLLCGILSKTDSEPHNLKAIFMMGWKKKEFLGCKQIQNYLIVIKESLYLLLQQGRWYFSQDKYNIAYALNTF